MRQITLRISVNLDEEALIRYWQEYPDLREIDGTRAVNALAREAIAAWDWDGLLVSGDQNATWTEETEMTTPKATT